MKTNNELQEDIINELKWEPLLNSSEIGVSVKDGIVNRRNKELFKCTAY
jgi:hypothetical protein